MCWNFLLKTLAELSVPEKDQLACRQEGKSEKLGFWGQLNWVSLWQIALLCFFRFVSKCKTVELGDQLGLLPPHPVSLRQVISKRGDSWSGYVRDRFHHEKRWWVVTSTSQNSSLILEHFSSQCGPSPPVTSKISCGHLVGSPQQIFWHISPSLTWTHDNTVPRKSVVHDQWKILRGVPFQNIVRWKYFNIFLRFDHQSWKSGWLCVSVAAGFLVLDVLMTLTKFWQDCRLAE